ncbi:hypothetical protein GWG54_18730 [Natronococcus sp. JC468]|nr:hypothetical protein [Natronococcus sp. JC468]
MDTIIIAVVVLLLGGWWTALMVRRHDADEDESDDAAESLDGFAPGAYHPTGAEYWDRTHDGSSSPHPPAPGVCPSCETENDPFYTYCRNCVERLSPA